MWRWSRPRAEGAPRALRAHVAAAEEGKEVNRVTGFARRGTPKKVPYVDFFWKIDWRTWESNPGTLGWARHVVRCGGALKPAG